jgi:ribonuclease-3
MTELTDLEEKIGYHFNDQGLLNQALTHSSTEVSFHQSYERLEFLGDRVLGLIVANLLYKSFPNESEGDLAKRLSFLVNSSILAEIATNLSVHLYVISALPEHFSKTEKKESIASDVCEALIAALYLDGGLPIASRFVETHWRPLLERIPDPPHDPKSQLQEWSQKHLQRLPKYRLAEKTGPDHNPMFTIELSIDPYGTTSGKGSSVRKAEKEAAAEMLKRIFDNA